MEEKKKYKNKIYAAVVVFQITFASFQIKKGCSTMGNLLILILIISEWINFCRNRLPTSQYHLPREISTRLYFYKNNGLVRKIHHSVFCTQWDKDAFAVVQGNFFSINTTVAFPSITVHCSCLLWWY